MREPLRDEERLKHMLAAIDRVIRYTKDKTYPDLSNDLPLLRSQLLEYLTEIK